MQPWCWFLFQSAPRVSRGDDMSTGVALKQSSFTLPPDAKLTPPGPLESPRDLLSGVYPDSGVGASDSDDDELRLLQSRSPSVTSPETSTESEADENEIEAGDDSCGASRSGPRQRHRHRRWRNPRSKQNVATSGPIIVVNGNAGLLCCGMQRKSIGKRKRRNLKRRTARKDGGGRNDAGGAHARTPPGATMWTNLQYFATTPAATTGSAGRPPSRLTTLSQAVQTDFAMIDAKSIERVFGGDPSGIAPEVAANILRTLSSERFSWGTLMRVLQADLQPKDGFGVYTWGIRRKDSQASRLPLPPAQSLRPPADLDAFRIGPAKPFLKIEGSRYTTAGLVRAKQQSVGHQTSGCQLPVQWFLPKHDARTPGELAIIMGRERNRKKKKTTNSPAARDSPVGSAMTQCTSGFSRTLEEGETKQRNMHVSTRSLRLPLIRGAVDDDPKKTGSASQLKSNRLPVSVTRQWPPHHRYGGSTRGPPDPGTDVHFEFSVVKLPRMDRHVSLVSSGVGSVTSPVGPRCRRVGAMPPVAPPVTPATSVFSPTPSLDVTSRSSCTSSTSRIESHLTPRYTPTLLSGTARSEQQRYLHKPQQDVFRVAEDGDKPQQESGAATERGYSPPEHAYTKKDTRHKPGIIPPRQRIRPVHVVSMDSVHSHATILKMPSLQHEAMNNNFRAGAIIKKPRTKTKSVE